MSRSRPEPAAGSHARRATIAVVLACCAFVLGAQAAPAAAPEPAGDGSLESTVAYLQSAQNSDGGFGGEAGAPSDPEFSSWAALALAAAGINPQDQARSGGTSAYAYLLANADVLRSDRECGSGCTTTFDRVLLDVDAAGADPHDFAGIDLVAELLARQAPDGSFPHGAAGASGVNDTEFAVLALSPLDEPRASAAVAKGAAWLEAEQDEDGAWGSNCARTEPHCTPLEEVDITAAGIEALTAAGRRGDAAEQQAVSYLRGAQNSDGGFPESAGGGESNSDSTAWAVQGIVAAGQSPAAWAKEGGDPLHFLESMQLPSGAISYRAGEPDNLTFNTAYALPALGLQPLPIAAVPRSAAEQTPATTQGAGVSAGGGGAGAPLFSTPQPQSKGHSRAGQRVLSSRSAREATTRSGHGAATVPTAAAVALQRAVAPASSPSPTQHASDKHPGGPSSEGGEGGANAEPEVSGLLLASSAHRAPDAPGLRGAASDEEAASALASAIAVLIALVVVAGMQFERRRPELVL